MNNLNEILAVNGIGNAKMTKDSQIEAISEKLFHVSKYEVNEPRPDFEKPDCVTIYDENGRYMGKAGKKYGIVLPQHFFDAIITGLESTDFDFTKNRIGYREINDGKVIEFRVPLQTFVAKKDAKLNDAIETYMLCSTSFDGTQSTRAAIYTKRLVCSNGMVVNKRDFYRAFRHTENQNIKSLEVTEAMAASYDNIKRFSDFCKELTKIKLTDRDRERIIKRITGYSLSDYKKLHRAKQNILDGIKNGLEFEKINTGTNDTAWSLFNAFTYHASHDLDGNSLDERNLTLIVGTGFKFNNKVQKEFERMVKI